MASKTFNFKINLYLNFFTLINEASVKLEKWLEVEQA